LCVCVGVCGWGLGVCWCGLVVGMGEVGWALVLRLVGRRTVHKVGYSCRNDLHVNTLRAGASTIGLTVSARGGNQWVGRAHGAGTWS